jgi:hypothetical protein
MSQHESTPSGSNAGVVVAIILALVIVPCLAGMILVGGARFLYRSLEVPPPAAPMVQPAPPQAAPLTEPIPETTPAPADN